MHAQSHALSHTTTVELPYLVYLPDDYEKSEQDVPLILFLHGKGERGNTLEPVKKHGLPKNIEAGESFPFITIAPQCPLNTKWEYHLSTLKQLVDSICETHRVDTNRIYLTGLSMGGSGTWSLATAYPNLFAAIFPICGRGRSELNYPERLQAITHLPVWHFHGDADTVVPLESGKLLVDNLKQFGGNPKLTVYEGVGHDSWTQTYDNPEIYEWFLNHSLDVKN